MDRDTLRNLLIAGAVFVFVMAVGPRLLGPLPQRPATEPTAPGTSSGDQGTAGLTDQRDAAPPSSAQTEPPPTSPAGGFTVVEAQDEQTVFLGSEPANGIEKRAAQSPYRMRLTLSSIGASVQSATMTDHTELGGDERYELLSPIEIDDRTVYRSLSIDQINVDGTDLALRDKKWHAGSVNKHKTSTPGGGDQDGQTVDFWIDIAQADKPALRLKRTFALPRQDHDLGRHDFEANLVVQNLSDQPHRVIVAYRSGLGVPQVNPRFDDRYVDWGVHDGTRVVGGRRNYADATKKAGQPIHLYAPSNSAPAQRLSWAATANTYFTCTIAPLNRDETDNAGYLAEAAAVDLDGSAATKDDVAVRFVSLEERLGPKETLAYPLTVYLGEKDGHAFRSVEEYVRRNYYYQIAKGFGWCTFTWLTELMIWLLNGLKAATHDYGVAIIILVLVVRVLLHPITKKGQVNMVRMQHRMQEMAPKIEEIKKKYGNDKARLNQEMMKLNINPAGQLFTCLPMLIQMPIWVALFFSLSNNVLMRHQPAFYGWTWADDLTAPDALFTFPSPIVVPFLGWEIPALNLLPILVAIFMYTQQRLQPKPKPNPNATDQQRAQQEMMQKMMPLMSIMMLLIFYKMPSGLNLYIMASSMFGTIEQHYIRKHIREREAAGTLHKEQKKKELSAPPTKTSGRMSFFEKLQKIAEKAQKAPPKRPAKTKVRR